MSKVSFEIGKQLVKKAGLPAMAAIAGGAGAGALAGGGGSFVADLLNDKKVSVRKATVAALKNALKGGLLGGGAMAGIGALGGLDTSTFSQSKNESGTPQVT
jgi:hypothetical protein